MPRAIRKKKVTLEDIAEMLTKGFASMHAHFDRIEKIFDGIDEIFDRIESRGKRMNEGSSHISKGVKEVVRNDI